MNDLSGLTIIVTRPPLQAQNFSAELSSRGARVISFPTIDIRFRTSTVSEVEQKLLADSSLWIFTSANAVTGALQCGLFNITRTADIACIGGATAAALTANHINPDLVPENNGDSESLLCFLKAQSFYQNVSIIRGGEGRNKLSVELSRQGATVHLIDVYTRVLPVPKALELQQFTDALPCTICITSNQGLLNLLSLSPADVHLKLLKSHLIVNSERALRLAKSRGFSGNIDVASPPGDQGQLAALLESKES